MLDTDLAGRFDAFNLTELLLAALAAYQRLHLHFHLPHENVKKYGIVFNTLAQTPTWVVLYVDAEPTFNGVVT